MTEPSVHAIRKLGALKPDQYAAVLFVVAQWLGLREGSRTAYWGTYILA